MGSHDYLINKLYEIDVNEIEYYIPELCHMVIKRNSLNLEKFLLNLATKDFIIY